MIAAVDKRALTVQRRMARLLALPTYHGVRAWLTYGRGYRVRGLADVRASFRALVGERPGPLLICPNHLTLIDSLIALWALAPLSAYIATPGLFAWNLPEERHVRALGLGARALCYVGKCVPVLREGPREETRRVLDKAQWLLEQGEALMVFPEGGRSRTGRVVPGTHAYGVGALLQRVPETRVVCMYLRGEAQDGYSDLPARGDVFTVSLRLLEPSSHHAGLRGQRDIANSIVAGLADMEAQYFAERRDVGRQ